SRPRDRARQTLPALQRLRLQGARRRIYARHRRRPRSGGRRALSPEGLPPRRRGGLPSLSHSSAFGGGFPTSRSHSPNITESFPLSDARFTLSVFALITALSFTLPDSATVSASNSPASSPSADSSPTFARP